MTAFFVVAAGGTLGALGRYAVLSRTGSLLATDFPFGTIVVNVVGSFVLGIVLALAAGGAVADNIVLFLAAGVLGSFTTFSTFALDIAYLAGRHAWRAAVLYGVASVVLSIGAFAAGLRLAHPLA